MRRQVRLVATGIALILLGAAVALMPGCTKSHPYEVRGVVRSTADGSPLAGVTVTDEAGHLHGRDGLPATTTTDGTFAFSFRASAGQFYGDQLPRWSVTLSRDGYIAEVVDISPRRKPASGDPPTQVVMVVYLRPN